ncbi:Pyridinium-3,5-bisthiocarboxylic acid mononucleotide nickel insertion protein [subsurface metagenome]
MVTKKIGYGAGERDFPFPNLLRVFLGTAEEISGDAYIENAAMVIEANIDDMNPEIYPYLMEKLLEAGAKDVYFIPMHMKKNRPGILLGAIAEKEFQEVVDVIFRETTTLGVRTHEVWRKKLSREEIWLPTKYGRVRAKLGILQGKVVNISPEYESCRELSQKSGVPLKDIYQEIQLAALKEKESTSTEEQQSEG